MIASPNHARKAWIWEQYDSTVMADTVVGPGSGAGIVRVHDTNKGLAFTSDVTPRYCRANPYEGGKQAVAEAFRNLSAKGARPLAATDNLNFGNPEKPSIMGQFVGCIQGIGDACRALNMPIVSGNVSLYNETDGIPILPTPTIGAVGLLSDLGDRIAGRAQAGDVAILIGETRGHLGQSALLADVFGRDEGDAPPVDLEKERTAGAFVVGESRAIRAATDLADGGLALAGFEMAAEAGMGLALKVGDLDPVSWFFGEDQARYLLAVDPTAAEALLTRAQSAGVPATAVGAFGGDVFALGPTSQPMPSLQEIYEHAFSAHMEMRALPQSETGGDLS